MNSDPYTLKLDVPASTGYQTGDFLAGFSSTEMSYPTLQLYSTISCEYNPQPDITAYELAQLIPYILGRPMYETDWEKLGVATRHLKRL